VFVTGYAPSSSAHVFGALRGPADYLGTRARRRRLEVAIGAISLAAILVGCLLLVVVAADRPSLLAATTTPHFFPHWMAGPLGGLWPSLTRSTQGLRYLFSGAIVLMYASYLLGLRYVPRLSAPWAIAAVLGAHAIMFLAPPLALTDIFNYINYGRMEIVHHLNPYTTTPILEPHSDPSFAVSNWHQLLSPYGPVFTLMTFLVVPLGVAASFWTLKGLLMLASLATVLLVWRSARLLGRDPIAAIVLVGLNPIVLVWGLGGDHNDFLMMFFVVLGFYLLLLTGSLPGSSDGEEGNRAASLRAVAGAAFVTAVAIKASSGILLPVVIAPLLRNRRHLSQVLLGMLLAAIVLGVASVAAFGPHFPDLATQGRLVTMVSLPNLFGLALGQGGETNTLRLLLSVVLLVSVAACSVLAWRRRDSLTAAGWASVALLVTLSWVLPWYVLWVLPLAALSTSRRLRTAALLIGVYFILAWAPIAGTVFNAVGFHPEKTSLGRLHQRYVKELLY
jgi:alpha-1,6-mannosyltransferase